MTKVYLCWCNDGSVLGIASSKKFAKSMCTELGDCYMLVELNQVERNYVDSTPLCVHNTIYGFLTYQDCLAKGIRFKEKK